MWGIWGVSWDTWGVSQGTWVCVSWGIWGVSWGPWDARSTRRVGCVVPGAQLSSPRGAGQASRVVLSPGGMGWDWLGMKNAGQERSMPAPPGHCGGRGACGPGRVRLKAPGAGVRAPPCLSIAHLFSRARDRGRGEDSSFCLWSPCPLIPD